MSSEEESGEHRGRELPRYMSEVEGAERVWDMITQRFPNAAPLLCEMEAVIERAEDLLEQLRAPRRRAIDTSVCSFDRPSEDTNSIESARESFAGSCNERELESGRIEQNIAETQISESSVCEAEVNLNSRLRSYHSLPGGEEYFCNQSVDPPPVSYSAVTNDPSVLDANDSGGTIDSTTQEPYFLRGAEETSSLEGWEKLVNSAALELDDDCGTTDGISSRFLQIYTYEEKV
ncbi:hypothetical protein KM043_009066 [Ampulex compressa]|nr:hypothetical protein KM043_009066 [Ampulex compressa]